MIIHTNFVAIQIYIAVFFFWLKKESVILKIWINGLELNRTQPIATFSVGTGCWCVCVCSFAKLALTAL